MYPCIEASKVKQFITPNSLFTTTRAVLTLAFSTLNLQLWYLKASDYSSRSFGSILILKYLLLCKA